MSALHIFDMDGTLLRGTTASLEISRHLDQVPDLEGLEHRFATAEITAADFAVAIHRLWAGLTDHEVDDIAARAPWISGIDEVCADITARGETSMLITMSPEFFARHLYQRGIEVIYASTFPPLPFTAPVDPAGILDPVDKVRFADTERTRRRLSAQACVAYGDSMSDEPLFAALANTVAVNADPRLEATARVAYRGDDLREAYAEGRKLLVGD